MYKTGIRSGQSLFALLSGFLFLFIFSSSVLASPEELDAVRQQIRNKGARWEATETSISKLPREERMKRLGFRKESLSVSQAAAAALSTESTASKTAVPATLNYNDYSNDNNVISYVTPIRDQGECGSCWAFGTTAALESQYLMSTQGAGYETLDLSEQVLLSCSNAGNCAEGGYPDLASDFIQSTGLPAASCFPYMEATDSSSPDVPCSDASCPYWQSDTYSINGWKYVATTAPTAAILKSALTTYGPLVTTMNVYDDFSYYSGGVYSYTYGSLEGSHVIEIIGYDDTESCFIVKNSWGTEWGEVEPGLIGTPGFFRIAYDQIDKVIQFGYYTIAYEGYKGVQNTSTYSISPTSVTVAYTAGYGNVKVTTQAGSAWTAASNVNWIRVVSGAKGTGDGTVRYYVTANPDYYSWTGTLTIAGQTFTVTQNAKPSSSRRR